MIFIHPPCSYTASPLSERTASNSSHVMGLILGSPLVSMTPVVPIILAGRSPFLSEMALAFSIVIFSMAVPVDRLR